LRYVIIGNSAAGTNAAETLRKLAPTSEITIISDEKETAYSRCLLSWYVDGSIEKEGLYFKTKHFYQDHEVEPLLGYRVRRVDRQNSRLLCDNGKEIDYDKLLIATGAHPFRPPIEGISHKNVFGFHLISDAENIINCLSGGEQVVVVGAGFVGLETAYAMARKGAEVTVVERLPQILPNNFDYIASQIFHEDLIKERMNVIVGKSVISINGDHKGVTDISLSDGTQLKCQLVVLATGVRPNSELAIEAGLNVNNGIEVDEYMRTNDPYIFSAGDVIKINDVTTGKRAPSATWYNAVIQGKYAAYNMVGQKRRYSKAVGIQSAVEFREIPAISFGTTKIDPLKQAEYDSLSVRKGKEYRKLVIKDDRLVGMVFVGDISNAGFYAKMIKNQINISTTKEKLLQPDFTYAYFKHLDFGERNPYF
jgi:nitrite reductase (NADH) large subunit